MESSRNLPRDVTVLIVSPNASTERRISPSWTIVDLKRKMEPITGIPPSAQLITYQLPESLSTVSLEQFKAEDCQIGTLNWLPYTKLTVEDGRPPGLRENYTDTSGVEKYEMPEEDYAKLSDSVLAWKKRNQLGRFDLKKAEEMSSMHKDSIEEINSRHIALNARCLVGDVKTDRRGEVVFIGLVPEIPGDGYWIGVRLDEPTGKNDGSVGKKRYFDVPLNHGIFIRSGRVTIGNYPPKDLDEDDLLEEI